MVEIDGYLYALASTTDPSSCDPDEGAPCYAFRFWNKTQNPTATNGAMTVAT